MAQYLYSFKAINPHSNVNRWYSVRVGKDLFGDWYILSSWGRIGSKGGQKKEYVFDSLKEVIKKAISICKKRLNASSRIGCNYVCTNQSIRLENIKESLDYIN
ncbi:MAG: WGR domain-containing protein [Thermodesulfobium sp.]